MLVLKLLQPDYKPVVEAQVASHLHAKDRAHEH